MKTAALIALFFHGLGAFTATAGPWEQCGGLNFNGPTECVQGYQCFCKDQCKYLFSIPTRNRRQ